MADPMELCEQNPLKRQSPEEEHHTSPKRSLEHPEAFPTPPLTASPVHNQSSDRQASPAPSSSALSSIAPSFTERPTGSSDPPPKKRRKLTAPEKQEQMKAKEQKDRERMELKAKREEEKRLKDEDKRRKNEEKEARQREKDMKKAEEDKERARKEEEKAKKEKSQMRLNSFFARPKVLSTPPPAAPSLSVDRKESPSAEPGSAIPSTSQTISTPRKSDYQRYFLSFEMPSHTTCAPYILSRTAEKAATSEHKADTLLEQLYKDASAVAKSPSITTFFTLQGKRSRGAWQPNVREVVESLNGSLENPIDLTDHGGQHYGPEDLLGAVTMRHLHFAEDVRPPYLGTYTKTMSPRSSARLRRRPFSRIRKDTNYDYDSEAEWEEPEEGEDILSEGEDDEESVGSVDEMEGFLDDAEVGDGKRRMITGDLKPVSSGMCWDDLLGHPSDGQDRSFNLDEMRIDFLFERPVESVDPFSTIYWRSEPASKPAPPKFTEAKVLQIENGKLGVPKSILQPRSSPNETIIGAASGMKGPIMAVASGKSAKPAAQPLKDEDLAEFQEAVVGSNINKIELLKALKKRFPKHTNDTIKRMNRLTASAEALVSRTDDSRENREPRFILFAATICLIWYLAVCIVCTVGYTQLRRWYSTPPAPSISAGVDAPHVSVIRPVKGLEPSLYQCLAATFHQDYPRERLKIFFCVSDRRDPACPTLQQLLADHPEFDAHLLVEEEDPALQGTVADELLGPNPKIRNMSRAYREAKGDIIWIVDCNVWVGKGACGRMVDTLAGTHGRKNKFVHLLPLVVDIAESPLPASSERLLNQSAVNGELRVASTSTSSHGVRSTHPHSFHAWQDGGGRIEELFMSSSHAKFYTAINTVLIAPCIVGKSTMFRRSHLNHLTEGRGIDFFSENICEDHLIGDLLWKKKVPEEEQGERWGKHAMVFGDLAFQPMAGMSVREYIARRVRWLRVRKFTVTLATLVEPGTESFLCSLYGAFAFTTLPIFHDLLNIPHTWTAFIAIWLLSVCTWAFMDWTLYLKLHSGASVEVDHDTPAFARAPTSGSRRPFHVWLFAWLARETLAFPVWAWAVFGGVTVVWRGKRFWVGMDMKVHEIKSSIDGAKETSKYGSMDAGIKARQD
ncbi:hypothetical protein MBLNU459_g3145t1 [Dothideomycetes sp. NU459]